MLSQTLKNTFIFIASLIIGGLIAYYIEVFGQMGYSKSDFSKPELYALYLESASPGFLAWILLSHALGALSTGYLLGKFLFNNSQFLFKIAALFWMFSGLIDILYVPHPIWFTISDLCVYYPMVHIGHHWASWNFSKKN